MLQGGPLAAVALRPAAASCSACPAGRFVNRVFVNRVYVNRVFVNRVFVNSLPGPLRVGVAHAWGGQPRHQLQHCHWPPGPPAHACRWQVRTSYDSKPYRRILMETWGATVHPSPSNLTQARAQQRPLHYRAGRGRVNGECISLQCAVPR